MGEGTGGGVTGEEVGNGVRIGQSRESPVCGRNEGEALGEARRSVKAPARPPPFARRGAAAQLCPLSRPSRAGIARRRNGYCRASAGQSMALKSEQAREAAQQAPMPRGLTC